MLREIAKMPIFFLLSWQKLKLSPNKNSTSPLSLSKVVYDSMAIRHVDFFTKTTLSRGWGGGLLFVFRGDESRAQKSENRWNCLNSFVDVEMSAYDLWWTID